jgi:WD40 repeat protein
LRTLTGHESEVQSVAVTPDGRHIVSGGEDGMIRVWSTPWLSAGVGRQGVSASIPSDQPLDRDRIAGPDQLGYKPYAAALFQLLSNPKTELPLSLAVSAPWGSGKTSIMRWISYELDYHRRNIHHQCTVIPGVEAWGGGPAIPGTDQS